MNLFARLIAVCGVVLIPNHGMGQASEEIAAEKIELILDELKPIRDAVRGRKAAPSDSGIFSKSKNDYTAELNGYLDQLFEVIIGDNYAEKRQQLFSIRDEIAALEKEQDRLRVAEMTARPSPAELSLVDRALRREYAPGSKESLLAQLEELETEITALQDTTVAVVNQFRSTLENEAQVFMNFDHAKAALFQLNGSSMVEAAAMFSILSTIEKHIGEIANTLGTSSPAMTEYYAISAVSRLLLVRLHERHLAQYENDWFPKFDSLEQKIRELREETQTSANSVIGEQNRAALKSNLKIQTKALETLERYRRLLKDRQFKTQEALAVAKESALVALNTLSTLEGAVMLSKSALENTSEFAALMSIEPLQLIPLDEEELFVDLSKQMAGS